MNKAFVFLGLFLVLFLAVPNVNADLTDGAVAYWGLDETSGTSADNKVSSSHDGILSNSGIISSDSKVGLRAHNYGGSTAWFTDTNGAFGSVGTSSFTFLVWTKISDTGSTEKFLLYTGRDGSFVDVFVIESISSTLRIRGRIGSGDVATLQSGSLNTSEYVLLGVTRSGTTAKLFINGVEVDNDTASGWGVDIGSTTSFIEQFGRLYTSSFNANAYVGLIDEPYLLSGVVWDSTQMMNYYNFHTFY